MQHDSYNSFIFARQRRKKPRKAEENRATKVMKKAAPRYVATIFSLFIYFSPTSFARRAIATQTIKYLDGSFNFIFFFVATNCATMYIIFNGIIPLIVVRHYCSLFSENRTTYIRIYLCATLSINN